MTRLAIWNPESLLGREIKDSLARRRDLWDDLRLLSDLADEMLVTDIGGEAALVQPAAEDTLDAVDLLFYCAASATRAEIPELVPPGIATIVVAGDGPVPGIPPLVAGIGTLPPAAGAGSLTVASADPALVALAHLLDPLRPLGLVSCTASLLLPSSTRGQEGIDRLLEQTRSILAFQAQRSDDVFGCQLAFNVVPGSLSGDRLVAPLRSILDDAKLELAIQVSLGGVFHGLAVGAHVRLAPGVGAAQVRTALAASPVLEFAARPKTLGPVDVAGSATIQLGPVEASSAPDSFWLRGVMDNLTLGGALNAIGIAAAILGARASGSADYTM